ncbi:hypothetical protein [Maribacter sp. MAR_2009_72]|uniref:hypothetical protein n=1 Tax=Maribacter sp. MAR_2009_72 TaxID=1250050 RepID=UPI00119BB2C3|nr:hypothetical protein [Maribacter sp. MAR_2009_72]TVZ16985.1 hypothetical protein JM81_3259 [Maribacter sp. MAR_2009_72]
MKKLGMVILILWSVGVHSQINGVTEKGTGIVHLERHQFKLDLFSPGLSYELGLFKNQSVSTALGLGMATYEPGYVIGLALNNRYRYYHNFNRRVNKNKNVSGNSGNYIAAAQAIFFSQARLTTNITGPDDFNLGFYGMVYGIQRTYPKGFNFNAELGAGYYRGDGEPSGYGPLVGFTFGWVPTKRTSRKPVFD